MGISCPKKMDENIGEKKTCRSKMPQIVLKFKSKMIRVDILINKWVTCDINKPSIRNWALML